MDRERALAVLGVADGAPAAEVRRAYRERMRAVHPDASGDAATTEAAADLARAYATLRAQPDPPVAQPAGAPEAAPVTLVGSDTIVVPAPPDEAFARLLDAAHGLGEVSYLDRANGFLEVVVYTDGDRAASLVVSLQGRATGGTEAFVTVEPLGRGPAVDAGPFTAALAGMVAARWS